MVLLFVCIVAVIGFGIYLTVVLRAVPGAVDERLGKLEDLPAQLGKWVLDETSATAKLADERGLVRETRVLLEPARGLFGGEQFVEQARLREGQGGRIVEVEPERRWSRKRHKA